MTLQTIADRVGVSRTTVSNAYSRPDQLNPELRRKILETAKELGYAGPDPAGRILRSGRAGAIGLLFAEPLTYAFGDPYAIGFLQGFAEPSEQAGAGLLLLPSPAVHQVDAATVRQALVDGLCAYSMPDDHPSVIAAVERHLPFVTADAPRLPGVPFVGIDDRAGARAAAEHVIALGHRRLGILAFSIKHDGHWGPVDAERRRGATFGVTRDRLAGYADAVTAAGLDWDAVPIYEQFTSRSAGAEGAAALLALDPRPTAILAMADELALGALDTARAAGLNVPQDLSVVGFDDAPPAAAAGLTTIRQPLVEKGAAAGRLLLERIEGREPEDVVFPHELVVRGTAA